MVVELLESLAIVPEHVALVRLHEPFRPVMSLAAHGWRVTVTLKTGATVGLRSWGPVGDGPSAEPQDARDEPEARAFYRQVVDAVASA